jgi:hypothetical protein
VNEPPTNQLFLDMHMFQKKSQEQGTEKNSHGHVGEAAVHGSGSRRPRDLLRKHWISLVPYLDVCTRDPDLQATSVSTPKP